MKPGSQSGTHDSDGTFESSPRPLDDVESAALKSGPLTLKSGPVAKKSAQSSSVAGQSESSGPSRDFPPLPAPLSAMSRDFVHWVAAHVSKSLAGYITI